ncbi:MAG: SDR family NAD(P)-dependent oxidoreductase [Bacteroides sp.]|nr:SDR family NAD(P)-dependent oxidoreductase [Bacteroides sp.]
MKRIIIIGASSGLGMEIAREFAELGWRVGIAARRKNRLEELRDEFPRLMEVEALDVEAPDAPARLHNLIDSLGGMDVILYAAGTGWYNPRLYPTVEQQTVAVNVRGFTQIIDTAYHYFVDTNTPGRIAAITSVAGTKALAVSPAYSASKRYQWNYLEALDQLAHSCGHNVRFTDLRPGFMDTALLAQDPKSADLPMMMGVEYAAAKIVKDIIRGRRISYIDWRWHALCAMWQCIPNCLWRRVKVLF